MRKIYLFLACTLAVCAFAADPTYLDQNWDDDDRQWFYTTPQGSKLISYSWAMALELPNAETRWITTLPRFGFLPNATSEVNPDGLPDMAITSDVSYKAPPLDGIWATAPYLHNGSVPSLWDLLVPEANRPKTFHVGSRAFDPVKVGQQTSEAPGSFLFDTSIEGNLNTGHTWGTTLSEEDRWALIEYLKSL